MNLPAATRRDFLKRVAIAAGGAVVGLSEAGCISSVAPVVRAQVNANLLRIETARPELANVGDGIQLDADALEYPVFLIKVSNDRFVALSTECAHLGCTVKKRPSVIRCSCHGSAYDFEGNVLQGPAERPLERFPVHMNGSIAEIEVR